MDPDTVSESESESVDPDTVNDIYGSAGDLSIYFDLENPSKFKHKGRFRGSEWLSE